MSKRDGATAIAEPLLKAYNDVMRWRSRRNFLSKLILYCAGFALGNRLIRQDYLVRRTVYFPRNMSRGEFETVSEDYCDHLSIQAFCSRMERNGLLLGIKDTFHGDRIVYDLTFKDHDSYRLYVNVITQNWFDFEKFKAMGFSADLTPVS